MNQIQALRVFDLWDKQGKYVFTKHELGKLFANDAKKAFDEGLSGLVKNNVLKELDNE